MSIGIVSGNSLLKSVDSSWARACLAIALRESLLASAAMDSDTRLTFEGLLHVYSLFGTRLEIWDATLGLAERVCLFG